MRRLIWRLVLASPLLLLVVLFALSNTQPVQVGLWPTGVEVTAPLSIAILLAMAVAFLLGALLVWVVCLGVRLRARRAEQALEALRREVLALRGRVPAGGGAVIPPGARDR